MMAGDSFALAMPAKIKQRSRSDENLEPSMEDAFIHRIETQEQKQRE
jgi:hypothetical protein